MTTSFRGGFSPAMEHCWSWSTMRCDASTPLRNSRGDLQLRPMNPRSTSTSYRKAPWFVPACSSMKKPNSPPSAKLSLSRSPVRGPGTVTCGSSTAKGAALVIYGCGQRPKGARGTPPADARPTRPAADADGRYRVVMTNSLEEMNSSKGGVHLSVFHANLRARRLGTTCGAHLSS